jgi:uncharacterized protein
MFVPTDVPKSNNTFWLAGTGFIRVVQAEPHREILLTGAAARLWEWIDGQNLTVADLLVRLRAEGIDPEPGTRILEHLHALGLITAENYLWKEGATP